MLKNVEVSELTVPMRRRHPDGAKPRADNTLAVGDAWHDVPAVGPRLGRYEVRGLLGAGGMGAVFEAIDPVLDRAVAIKVLRGTEASGEGGAERLLREGVTMARLTHPNVIRVYDVGVEGGHVFVAMELVRGGTLAEWATRGPRAPEDVIRAYVQAGRGLAAAHEAGLVHRDFKPQNVLVADDGRVLVTDFGLARAVDDDEPAFRVRALGSPAPFVTEPGRIVGTPAFMAPEQRTGGAVDARADQYSFCLALWSALTAGSDDAAPTAVPGTPPATDTTLAHRVPSRIRGALLRGLAPVPEHRFPSMRELLAALEPRPPRRWPVPTAVAALVAAAAAVAFWLARPAATEACPTPSDPIARVWGRARGEEARARLVTIDPAQGAARFAAAARAIDPYVEAWSTAHVETCKDTRVRGRQSDALLDVRMRCLDRRLAELDGSIDLLMSSKDAAELDAAFAGLFGLTSVEACADGAELARRDALPADPTRRRGVEALGARIEQAQLEQRASRLVGLPGRADQLVAEARVLGHPATLVRALATAADVHLTAGHDDAGVAALRELTQVAATAGDDRAEATGWITLVSTVGARQLRPEEALTLVPAATAAIHRAGDPLDLRVDLLLAEAKILDEGPRLPEALTRLAEARRLLTEPDRALPPDLRLRLADVLVETAFATRRDGDDDGAVALYVAAIDVYRELYGPDSVAEAIARHNIGDLRSWDGHPDEALAALHEAARINRGRLGPSPRLASNLVGIAKVHGDRRQWREAAATYEEALAMLRASVGAGDVSLVPTLVGLAEALGNLERDDDAHRVYDELLALIDASRATTRNEPIALYNRAELARRRGRCDRALADYRRSAERFEATDGPGSALVPYPLIGEGACLVTLGRARAAVAPLERAITILSVHPDAEQLATALDWRRRARAAKRR